jgi:hypothetical protein
MISFLDVVAGVLIGAVNPTWLGVLASSVAWGFGVWVYLALTAGRANYKPGTLVFFGSPALTRFMVWWTTAAATSLVVGSIVFVVRQSLH